MYFHLKILTDKNSFKHKITREVQSSRPPECLGGILADEMGMGKSLALLALIVHTLGHANLQSQGYKELDIRVGAGESSSKTTLIITPKSSNEPYNLTTKPLLT